MAVTTKGTERTLGQLVADASSDVSSIIKGEIALAKLEIKSDVSKGGKGAAMLAAAGVFALFMLGFLLSALAWGLHELGLPVWASMLIVAGVLLLITLVLIRQLLPPPDPRVGVVPRAPRPGVAVGVGLDAAGEEEGVCWAIYTRV